MGCRLCDGPLTPAARLRTLLPCGQPCCRRGPGALLCSTEGVRALAARAAQACFLLRVLTEHNIGRLGARLDEGARAALRSLRFRCAPRACKLASRLGCGSAGARRPARSRGHASLAQRSTWPSSFTHAPRPRSHVPFPLPASRELVASEEGVSVATQLISVLVAQHLLSTGE